MSRDRNGADEDLVRAFTAALKYIERSEFICTALYTAYVDQLITRDQRLLANKLIYSRLAGKYELSAWIREHFPELNAYRHCYPDSVFNDRMLATRKAWLKSLIKEFGG